MNLFSSLLVVSLHRHGVVSLDRQRVVTLNRRKMVNITGTSNDAHRIEIKGESMRKKKQVDEKLD